jgi:putative ABC transport system permease protein
VRVALGASRSRILRMVVWQGARTAAIGGAVGLAMALVTARLLSTVLFGVPPIDPMAMSLTVVVVAGVAAAATYLPARRAAALNPMAAVRVH